MGYNPNFSRNSRGKFNPELGFVSIKGGTDAYLLEDELNEIQWIQNEARAEILRKMSNSGCMQIYPFGEQIIAGGLKELLHNNLNSFLLYGFDALLNGYLAYIDKDDLSGNIITLPNPPSSGTRNDFVFLELWFNDVKQYENIKRYGGFHNQSVGYEMIDSRLGLETSRRVQLQWNIRVVQNINSTECPRGFVTGAGLSNLDIMPMCATGNEQSGFSFREHSKDTNLYISGNGSDPDREVLRTVDGYCYAIPLFFVKRLNNSGYDPVTNPDGSIDYVDSNSISTRPDGKFSNIIYNDNEYFIDLRTLAIVGSAQMNTLYATKASLDEYQLLMNEANNNLLGEVNIIKDNLTALEALINSIIDDRNGVLQPWMDDISSRLMAVEQSQSMQAVALSQHYTWLEELEQRLLIVETQLKSLGMNLELQILIYYGVAILFNRPITTGGIIVPEDNTINSQGALLSVPEIARDSYAIIYTVCDSVTQGQIGDIWIEKADSGAVLKNTGYSGINVNTAAFANENQKVRIGCNNIFNGMDGIEITYVLADTDFVFITPTQNIYGTIGEIYCEPSLNGFTVYNTGQPGTTFDYVVIDTTQLTHAIMQEITFSGTTNITGEFGGGEFRAFIGPSNRPAYSGSIGDVSIIQANNQCTIFNTGTSIDSSAKAKCLIFKELAINEAI